MKMKKLIGSLLAMAMLVGHVPAVNVYATVGDIKTEISDVNVRKDVYEVVNDYMELRSSNMQNDVAAEEWGGIVVEGIVRDEALYASELEANDIQVLDTEYEIISVNGTEIVYVEVIETIKMFNDISVEVLHKVCVVATDEGNNIVVSDEYYDYNIAFASCSYVDETVLVEPSALSGSSLCILEVARNEEGYCEKASNSNLDSKTANAGSANYTKYGKWYGMNGQAWCAMFVSWCANQAQVSTNIIPKVSLTEDGMASFKSWNKFENSVQYGGNYTPKPGDVFYLSYDATDTYHTGIVVSVSGNTMICIEGNTDNNMVELKSRSLTSSSLRGFGTPAYVSSTHKWVSSNNVSTCSICGATDYITIN